MANNTGNPIGSTAAKDLSDNAENLDKFANGDDYEYDDRLGRSRKSLKWIEDAALAIPAIDAALRSEQQAERSESQAERSEQQAEQSRVEAERSVAAKVESEAARDTFNLNIGRKADIAEGLRGTVSGQSFTVLAPDAADYIIEYKNNAGTALEMKRYPSAQAVPKTGVEGVYNLINPSAQVTSGVGLNGSNDYTGVATVKSLAIRVTAGQPIIIYNPSGNYSAGGGYGAAFFSDLPSASNKVAAFNGTTQTNLAGLTYRAGVVPAGAKYLVLNTEFQGVQNNWFAAYDTVFNGAVSFEAVVARMDGQQVFDRKLNRQFVAAFSAVEGAENLYSSSGLLVGYLSAEGGVRRDNAAWRYVKIPVVEGRVYALYTGTSAWNFPVMGSYGVAGADPAASGAMATLVATTDSFVRTFTVPKGQGITHFYFNVFIKPPGGDIDFTAPLIIREGTTVPVRVLPYEPTLPKVNGLPVKDSQARSALIELSAAISQRTGRYNLLNPAAPVAVDLGLNGQANYGALATGRSLAIPVTEGMPVVIHNPAGNYLAYSGYGAAFFSEVPTNNSTKIRNFSDPLITTPTLINSAGLTYRRDVVPAGAKYLVLNTEFQGTDHQWFVAYDTGFTAPEAYAQAITEVAGVPIIDRTAQVMLAELGRGVPGRFTGKKVKFFGDSITEGGGGFPSYTNKITQILQCEGTNHASSGSWASRMVGIMTNLNPRDGTQKKMTADYTDVAAITIMIGSNDAGTTGAGINGSLANIPSQRIQDLPFTTAGGVLVSTPDEYWALFPNTYYGNLSLCIEYVKWKNPLTVIYLISATHREPSIVPMDAVVTAMTAIARFYSVQYFNATHECGVDFKNIRTYSYDGLHPNEQGVERIGKYVGYRILHS